MSDFVERMQSERADLKGRADKLKEFISSEKFKKLDAEYQRLLNRQLGVMMEYLIVLGQRLARAKV